MCLNWLCLACIVIERLYERAQAFVPRLEAAWAEIGREMLFADIPRRLRIPMPRAQIQLLFGVKT